MACGFKIRVLFYFGWGRLEMQDAGAYVVLVINMVFIYRLLEIEVP